MQNKPVYITSKPTLQCRIGRHQWEGTSEHRRCLDCLKVQVRSGRTGKWYTKQQYNMAWCSDCGNEMVGCPTTGCAPIEGGASRVLYACGRCPGSHVFDYGIAPVAIKIEAADV